MRRTGRVGAGSAVRGVLGVGGLWDLGSSGHQDLIQAGSRQRAFVGRGYRGRTGGESGAFREVGKGELERKEQPVGREEAETG